MYLLTCPNQLCSQVRTWMMRYVFNCQLTESNDLSLRLVVCSCLLLIFCKQFRPKSGPTKRRALSGSKPFEILVLLLEKKTHTLVERVNFERISRQKHAKFPSMQLTSWRNVVWCCHLLQFFTETLVGWFCCFTSQVNSYGHVRTVISSNHTFFPGQVNQYFVHKLSLVEH